MKKIISILTVFSMLLATVLTATVVPFAANASEISAAAYYDEKLVGWWNFEGSTKTEMLADKSQGGVADNMTAQSAATFDTNGVAVMPAMTSSWIKIPNTGDINSLDGKTLYLSYRSEGTAATTGNNLIYFRQTVGSTQECIFRYNIKAVTSDFYRSVNPAIGGVTGKTNGWKSVSLNSAVPGDPAEGEYYHLAITFDFDANGNATVEIYSSNDGSTYVRSALTVDASQPNGYLTSDLSGSNVNLLLGCAHKNYDMTFIIDDVRYYDAVLDANAVAALASYTPYSQDTNAVDTVDGLHDANLVAYYDFEGETPYADKAPNGEVADDMNAVNVTAANGVANVPADAGSYLSIAKGSADVADLNGKTIYVKYNTTGAIGGESNPDKYGTDMFNANDTFRYWLANPSTATYYKFGARTISAAGKNVNFNTVNAPTALSGDWYYTAFTFDLQADQLVIKIYNSANGSSYSVSDFVSSGEQLPADLVCELDILFGKHTTSTNAASNRGIGFNFDEIRVYNTVLSADDIAGLSTETPRESCINLLGWQDKDNGNGTQDVRFLAHLNVFEEDLAKFSSVGFKITATYKGETKAAKEITADTVYTSVIAGNETVTLADYDQINGYIIALPVWNVPTDSEVVFTVQTFYQLIGSDAPVYGEAVNVVYNAA